MHPRSRQKRYNSLKRFGTLVYPFNKLTISMANDKNLTYRQDEIKWTLNRLNAGNSCALVGVGSVGKSNLVRHLMRPEVHKAYLGKDADQLHLILIDPNNMLDTLPPIIGSTDRTSWSGYEIMTHRLYRYFHPYFAQMPPNIGKEFYEVYQNLLDGENPMTAHTGLRMLEHCLDLMIGQGSRLAFVFDEFEQMLHELPSKFFRTLRGVRDDHKYELMYVTVSRKTIPDLVIEHGYDYDALEPFTELFSDNIRYISALSEPDARDMLEQLADRQEMPCTSAMADLLIRITGGHSGLLRSAFSASRELSDNTSEDVAIKRLVGLHGIQAEARTLWASLEAREQAVLLTLIGLRQDALDPRQAEFRVLREKQLIGKRGDRYSVTPPLLAACLATWEFATI